MSRKILGIDIRHDSVTAVLASTSLKGSWIEDAITLSIPDGNEAHAENRESLSAALETIGQKMDLSGSVCAVSLPPELISVRNLAAPFGEKKKIEQILPFELEPTIPLPIDDLIIDFHTLKLSGETDHTDLLVAAVQKSALGNYAQLLSSLNIHPKIITFGGYCQAICINRFSQPPNQWLSIDMDTRHATIIGATSEQICLIRTISLNIQDNGMPEVESLCRGIRQTLAGFEEISLAAFQPEVIYLTGNSQTSSTAGQEIQSRFGCPVQKVDLIRSNGIGYKDFSAGNWQSDRIADALSLALIEIEGIDCLNFRKGPFAEKNIWVEHKKELVRIGIFAVLALISGLTYFLADAIYTRSAIAQVDRQIDQAFKTTFPEAKTIQDTMLQYQQMQVKLNELKGKNLFSSDSGANIRAIDILNQISKNIPDGTDVQFTRLVIGDDNVQITGDTDTLISVDNMKNGLEKAPEFKEITITSANREQSGNRVRFKLKVQL